MKPWYFVLLILAACHSAQEPTIYLPTAAIYAVDSVERSLGPGLRKAAATAYCRLGDSLLDKGYCDTAIKAFQIAERLGFQPRADLMYKLSASYAGKLQYADDPKDELPIAATRYAELAIQMGYPHPENFKSNPEFAAIKENGYFITVCSEAITGAGRGIDSDQALWENFSNEFSPLSLPLTIDQHWINTHPIRRKIALTYESLVPEYRTVNFSRIQLYGFFYVGLIKRTPRYTALLYAGKSLALMQNEEDTRATFIFLVTYDNNGRIIDKLLAAGQRDFTEPSRQLAFQPYMSFAVKSFRNIYEHDPSKTGYENNPIIHAEPAGEASYRIAATGRFEKLQPSLALR